MLCAAYCTAASYQLNRLFDHLKDQYKATRYREVIHLEVAEDGEIKDIFCFAYGAIIFWNYPKEKQPILFSALKAFENEPLAQYESDVFHASFGAANQINGKQICLSSNDPLSKLAASYAMAQSVKLGTFEAAITKTIDSTRQIPEDLASKGKIRLKRHDLRRKMGALFIERHSINLHLDFLNKPEFFWDHEAYEPIYNMTALYLDIQPRVTILNQKLTIVHELFQMMRDELSHQQSTRVEWIIVILILIEVLITVMTDILEII